MDQRLLSRRDLLSRSARAAAWLALPEFSQAPRAVERKGERKTVVVIGAGLAGLSAAYELDKAGHKVTVLEARNRSGGRVLTLREPFADGLYAEAGAESFGESHDFVQHYVKAFDLSPMPARNTPPNLAALYYLLGHRIKPARMGMEWPVKLPASEQKMSWHGLWRKYIQPAVKEIGNPRAAGWPPEALLEFDRIPFEELLRQRGASAEAIAILKLGYSDTWDNGTGPDSALCTLRDEAIGRDSRAYYRIAGGNDRLPKAFATRLGRKILFGAPVVRIAQNASKVSVTFTTNARRHRLPADYVVCAIPFTVLRKIPIEPAFTAGKQNAIQELSYQSVTRVFIESKTKYWIEEGLSGYAATDLPIMTVWDASTGEASRHGILECYISGESARRVGAMADRERVRLALENLEKVFPGMREHCAAGSSVAWDSDVWSRGAFAWFKAGQMTTLLPHLATPEGRIFFAGEHTSPWFGWMQGALESGNRAAHEVNDAQA